MEASDEVDHTTTTTITTTTTSASTEPVMNEADGADSEPKLATKGPKKPPLAPTPCGRAKEEDEGGDHGEACPVPSTTGTPGGQPSDDAPPPYSPSTTPVPAPPQTLAEVLALTTLPPETQTAYALLLESDGATTANYLLEAHYTRPDLLEVGIKRPHIDTILQAINSLVVDRRAASSASSRGDNAAANDARARVSHLAYLQEISSQHVPIPSRELLSTLNLPLSCGACGVVVSTMKSFVADAAVQQEGCRALSSLLLHSSHAVSNKRSLVLAGVCQALVAAMGAHPHDCQIQKASIDAVGLFVCQVAGQTRPDKAVASLLVDAGVHTSLIGAIVNFPRDSEVQAKAWTALSMLTQLRPKTDKDLLYQAGVCSLVLTTLDDFPSDPQVQFAALGAIMALNHGHKVNKETLGQLGACQRVITAMKTFPNEHGIVIYGLWCILGLLGEKMPFPVGCLSGRYWRYWCPENKAAFDGVFAWTVVEAARTTYQQDGALCALCEDVLELSYSMTAS